MSTTVASVFSGTVNIVGKGYCSREGCGSSSDLHTPWNKSTSSRSEGGGHRKKPCCREFLFLSLSLKSVARGSLYARKQIEANLKLLRREKRLEIAR